MIKLIKATIATILLLFLYILAITIIVPLKALVFIFQSSLLNMLLKELAMEIKYYADVIIIWNSK